MKVKVTRKGNVKVLLTPNEATYFHLSFGDMCMATQIGADRKFYDLLYSMWDAIDDARKRIGKSICRSS